MRRRSNPYSRQSQIEGSRQALREIVVLVLVAGVLVNLLSGWLATLLQRYLIGDSLWREAAVYLALLLALALVLILFIARYHSRAETNSVRIEVVLPYFFSRTNGLEVSLQHRFRPPYAAATQARQAFARQYRKNLREQQEMATAWLDAPRPKRIQQHLAACHECLIDALILQALHRYGDDSIGPAAVYDWYAADLEAVSWAFPDLPARLQENPTLLAQQKDARNWHLLLPHDVTLSLEDTPMGWAWQLKHNRYGAVTIECFAPAWARRNGHAVEIFSEGLRRDPGDELWIMGTRCLTTASFNYTMFRRVDPYHLWATRLLSYLEEALDWNYFVNGRQARVVADLPWKIGDLPDKQHSLWLKLEALEDQLNRLEKRV